MLQRPRQASVNRRTVGLPQLYPLTFTPQHIDNRASMTNMVEITPLNIEAVNLDDEREVDAFHEARGADCHGSGQGSG